MECVGVLLCLIQGNTMDYMSDSLISMLDGIDQRFSAIDQSMNDPEIASDGMKMIGLARERAKLDKIVLPYRKYKDLVAKLIEGQSLLEEEDADPEIIELAEGEIQEVSGEIETVVESIKELLVMSDDSAIDSIILEIRPGTGGDEASLFCGDLLNMYLTYAERKRWKVETLAVTGTELGGYREVILNIKGSGAWARLGYEGGGHRVQRVPKTESQGRIHTSAATVAVLPEPESIDIDIDWDKDVVEHVSRAGGPGGQSVNKLESAVKLEHLETGITVSMRDEKSQHKNRAKARQILAARLYEKARNEQASEEAAARKAMIGSGDRSSRVRTYNFPQNRCTDHRLREGGDGSNFNLDKIITGDLDEMIDALVAQDKAQRLANLKL